MGLLDMPLPKDMPQFDAVNLCCMEQVPLSELLTLLAAASGHPQPTAVDGVKRPRLAVSKNPKAFLPSVDRPWPLNLQRACKIYGFTPTPLKEVLKRCAVFFKDGCRKFPREARAAAKKLPGVAADIAMKAAGLDEGESSGES